MLNAPELSQLLNSLEKSPSEPILVECAKHIAEHCPSDANVAAALARTLAKSGETISVSYGDTADVASTGGPSSLSTILCPLLLRAAGAVVPKLGVPGRPAGGIDCLAQLPGYQTSIPPTEVSRILASSGYAHFLAGRYFAPLDAQFFQVRQRHGYQSIPTLAAASLLSKKLALDVRNVGLDVRVSPFGNFGTTWEDARKHANMIATAAASLGLRCTPVLTEGRYLLQPYLGRRESLVGLYELLRGSTNHWLMRHAQLCRSLAANCLPDRIQHLAGRIPFSDLQDTLSNHLEAQGSSIDEFMKLCERTKQEHTHVALSKSSGFASASLAHIRDTIVQWQSFSATQGSAEFPDPIGIIFLHEPGSWICAGEPVATLRIDPAIPAVALENLRQSLESPSQYFHALGAEAIHA